MNDPTTDGDAGDALSNGSGDDTSRAPSNLPSAGRSNMATRSVSADGSGTASGPGAAAADPADTTPTAGEPTAASGDDAAAQRRSSGGGGGDDADGAASSESDDATGGSAWDALRPLGDDDLAALDPSALEDDLDAVDVADDPATDEPPPPAPPAGPASSRTAAELTAATVLRTPARPPRSGWRRMIHRMTGGAVSPGASRSDREREDQLRAIRTLVTHPRRITVLSRKGGVGKTTTTLMLGQTLASERGDRIIAVDGNPDAGNLGYRIDPSGPDTSVTDLLNGLENVHRYADMRRFTTQTTVGLEVLRSDDDPQISTALGDQEYGAILSLLDRFYNLVLIDTGTGILDSAVQGILDGTDQIVLVVSPSLDAARSASQTLDWLTEHGFVGLVENAVAVINQSRRSTMVDVARIEDHFWDRCGATVRIPWDGFLEAGAETELADLRPATREAYRHLAAAVA
ncbi:MAG TPA: MinD/ParA family protein, partial [Euzebyales bacterium]